MIFLESLINGEQNKKKFTVQHDYAIIQFSESLHLKNCTLEKLYFRFNPIQYGVFWKHCSMAESIKLP